MQVCPSWGPLEAWFFTYSLTQGPLLLLPQRTAEPSLGTEPTWELGVCVTEDTPNQCLGHVEQVSPHPSQVERQTLGVPLESTGRFHQPSPICSGPCQGLNGFQNWHAVQALVLWAMMRGWARPLGGAGIYPVRRKRSGTALASSSCRTGR